MTTGKLRWEIQPHVGLGPVRLGMAQAEIAGFDTDAGAPILVEEDFGFVIEHRPHYTPKCEYQDGKLVDIDTHANDKIDVVIDGIDVFATSPRALLAHLAEKNGGVALSHGAVVFAKLGIVTGGFWINKEYRYWDPVSGEQDDRTLAIFDKDAFVRSIADITQFTLP